MRKNWRKTSNEIIDSAATNQVFLLSSFEPVGPRRASPRGEILLICSAKYKGYMFVQVAQSSVDCEQSVGTNYDNIDNVFFGGNVVFLIYIIFSSIEYFMKL